jgi:hypothetical protein
MENLAESSLSLAMVDEAGAVRAKASHAPPIPSRNPSRPRCSRRRYRTERSRMPSRFKRESPSWGSAAWIGRSGQDLCRSAGAGCHADKLSWQRSLGIKAMSVADPETLKAVRQIGACTSRLLLSRKALMTQR